MKPGPELDFLICREVMKPSGNVQNVPRYSTDISAAMEVAHQFAYFMIVRSGNEYSVMLSRGNSLEAIGEKIARASSDSLPHAICLAALEAE